MSAFVVGRRNPCRFAGLAVLFSDFGKVRATLDGSIDTVSQSFGLGSVFRNNLNLAVLDRVGHSGSSQFLERVDCIIRRIVVRTVYTAYLYRIQTGNNVGRQRLVCVEQVNILLGRTG